MEAVTAYILRLVCGALVCALLMSLTGANGPGGKLRSLLCGLFLGYLALSPLVALDLDGLRYTDPGILAQAEELARSGEEAAREAMAGRISEACEAYILSKADELHLTLEAEVIPDPVTGIPVAVRISGSAPPGDREALIRYITQTLGVERSGIQW